MNGEKAAMSVEEKMRVAVVTDPRRASVREVPVPRPGAGQVLVQLEGCGVCGSNLPLWEGRPWFNYPAAPGNPGHEGWGRVVEVGSEVSNLCVGERVAFLSERAFAEYDVANENALVKLPGSLDGMDVPGEPLGCVMNIWRRSQIKSGQRVAVVGVGFLGALLIRLANKAGAEVVAVSRRPYSLELARQMGASRALPIDDPSTTSAIWEWSGGGGCERVIEAVGLQQTLDVATNLCGIRGRLIIAGFHQDGNRQVDLQLWNWRGLDVVNAHERDPQAYVEGMRAAVDAMVSGELEVKSLITHRVPLSRSATAFELLRTRPRGFVKAVVVP